MAYLQFPITSIPQLRSCCFICVCDKHGIAIINPVQKKIIVLKLKFSNKSIWG